MMRYLYVSIFFILTTAATTVLAQDQAYPDLDNALVPYNDSPSYQNSPPAGVPFGNAPPRDGHRSEQPDPDYLPRASSFRPERAASYSPANGGSYSPSPRPSRLPPTTPWGPPPDIHSIAPEGRLVLPPAQPRGVIAPENVNVQGDPAPNGAGPDEAGPEPEIEFFEPNPDDLKDSAIWYQPSTWEDFGWETTIELGLNGSAGNSRTNNFKVGGKTERKTGVHKFLFELVHNRAANADVSTQNNAIGKLRYDRNLGESRWSLFGQGYGEYDEFKDFDLRLATNSGVTYKFLKTDTTTFSGDFGSGVSHEIGGLDDSYVPEAIFGLSFKHKLSSRQQLYVKTEYFPDWGDFTSYRVVTDAGWELLLDEEWGLNLKIGVLDRYDSTPGTRKANDLNYSMLLLWKL